MVYNNPGLGWYRSAERPDHQNGLPPPNYMFVLTDCHAD
uniref:Uncharacterized protein n=1 Tax=Arundo donax TaxID=35708 RepID=A0A0A9BBI9_ARUDO